MCLIAWIFLHNFLKWTGHNFVTNVNSLVTKPKCVVTFQTTSVVVLSSVRAMVANGHWWIECYFMKLFCEGSKYPLLLWCVVFILFTEEVGLLTTIINKETILLLVFIVEIKGLLGCQDVLTSSDITNH